jgi:heme-binding NEAT domain protein
MKTLLISTLAAALVASFAVSADAASNKRTVSAEVQTSCKAQAAKKYSAIHFIKRSNFIDSCVARHAKASAPKATKPSTTGQAPKKAQ